MCGCHRHALTRPKRPKRPTRHGRTPSGHAVDDHRPVRGIVANGRAHRKARPADAGIPECAVQTTRLQLERIRQEGYLRRESGLHPQPARSGRSAHPDVRPAIPRRVLEQARRRAGRRHMPQVNRCSSIDIVPDHDLRRLIRRCALGPSQLGCERGVIGRQQQLLRIDFETAPGHEALLSKLADFERRLGQADVVILSDYGKGGLQHIARMIELCRRAAKPVLVDPKGEDYGRYRGATLLTPNRSEFRQVAGHWSDEASLERKAQALRRDLGLEALLVTRSAEGLRGRPMSTIPTRDKAVIYILTESDSSAARDTLGMPRWRELRSNATLLTLTESATRAEEVWEVAALISFGCPASSGGCGRPRPRNGS